VPTIRLEDSNAALDLALFLLRAGARVEVEGTSVGVSLPGALDDAKERAEVLAYVETWNGLKEGVFPWELTD
jgi:hypothetical protein